jgi:hypothetical protein
MQMRKTFLKTLRVVSAIAVFIEGAVFVVHYHADPIYLAAVTGITMAALLLGNDA